MSGTWASGWATGDVVTAAEIAKGVGAIYDTTLGIASASIDVTPIVGTYAHLIFELRGAATPRRRTCPCGCGTTTTAARTTTRSRRRRRRCGVGRRVGRRHDRDRRRHPRRDRAGERLRDGAVRHPRLRRDDRAEVRRLAVGAEDRERLRRSDESYAYAHWWRSTAAINRITLLPSSGNFIIGTRLTIYAMGA
jgi:hypothetical protein